MTIAATGVTQDEAVAGPGDGDGTPDALIEAGGLMLRAERSGSRNGRIYRVHFVATDAAAGSCTGSVSVCVPRSRKASCTDSGQSHDSTQP